MSSLAGKVALVTGSSGIAAATARRLAQSGAAVCVVGIEADQVATLAGSLAEGGANAIGVEADLRTTEQTEAAFARCSERLGPPDIVVAVAGGSGRRFGDGPIGSLSLEAWRATFELNATPVMTTARAAIEAFQGRGGSLIIVSSVLALSPAPPQFETHAYAAAKGAALSLVKSLAASHAADGIRVNAVLPALTDTPMAQRAANDRAIQAYVAHKQPLVGGMLDPEDVAGPIVFLSSDEARAITGQLLAVDGGWSVSQAT